MLDLIKEVLSRRPANRTLVQLGRYTIVGGFAFLIDFGTLFLLTSGIGVHYLLSAALAFCLGLATNYALSVVWVFHERRLESRSREFTVFGIIGIAGLGINELSLWVLTGLAGLHYLGSKLLSTVVVYLWNFFVRKTLLFDRGGAARANHD